MRSAIVAGSARRCRQIRVISIALLTLLLLPGCAGLPSQLGQPASSDLHWVLSGADHPPPADAAPPETFASLLHVTPAMHQFAVAAVAGLSTTSEQVNALHMALSGEDGLGLRYDAEATLSAEQAFTQHRVNCLAYALLFNALARDVGIPAEFNEVEIPPVWDIGDDKTVMLYRHVNVRIDIADSLYQIIDISDDNYDPKYPQHIIPDNEILAQYYNNRAVEARIVQHYPESLRYQILAVQTAPRIDYLWANLANLYMLLDSPNAARIAIAQALTLDSTSMMNYDIAAGIFQRLGNTEVANSFQQQVRFFLAQNPYYHYKRALAALNASDTGLAYDEIRSAISLDSGEHRFYFLAAIITEERGDDAAAKDYLHRALALTADGAQQRRYQSKFARLTAQQG